MILCLHLAVDSCQPPTTQRYDINCKLTTHQLAADVLTGIFTTYCCVGDAMDARDVAGDARIYSMAGVRATIPLRGVRGGDDGRPAIRFRDGNCTGGGLLRAPATLPWAFVPITDSRHSLCDRTRKQRQFCGSFPKTKQSKAKKWETP
jgi:hypothetical protein